MGELEHEDKFAILIDADNISYMHIGKILSEVSKYGKSTIRRAYGDWMNPSMVNWKPYLLDNAISPISQCNIPGKNSTDSAMIIDAMDILYSGAVDGFCLAASDSDYTKLATRIRESGAFVIGMGEEKTPLSFRRACDIFSVIETAIPKKTEKKTIPEKTEEAEKKNKNAKIPEEITQLVKNFISDREGEAHITEIKNYLLRMRSDFNEKEYGFSKFLEFIGAIDGIDARPLNPDDIGPKIYVAYFEQKAPNKTKK